MEDSIFEQVKFRRDRFEDVRHKENGWARIVEETSIFHSLQQSTKLSEWKVMPLLRLSRQINIRVQESLQTP